MRFTPASGNAGLGEAVPRNVVQTLAVIRSPRPRSGIASLVRWLAPLAAAVMTDSTTSLLRQTQHS